MKPVRLVLTRILLAAALFSFIPTTLLAQDQVVNEDTILILDASGSMWGQINGINKIVIAKDVVEGLVRSFPEDRRLGVVAYGHRRKGDCSDIQTLADVGADRDKVISQLRGLTPTGKTPLTKSVEHAATELNYTKNAATVILVSDGLETCDADPCALAKTLEENGLDFTVHVIGFDVTVEEREGLECIATETGGEFLAADNAEELTDALKHMAVGEVDPDDGGSEPAPLPLVLKATILAGGPEIQSDLAWRVWVEDETGAQTGEPVFTAEDTGYEETVVAAGNYVAEATWTGWRKGKPDSGDPKTGRHRFTVGGNTTVVTVPIDLGIPVTLEAPGQTPQGVAIDVTWTGPDSLGAYITTNSVEDGPREMIYFQPTQKARNAYRAAAEKEGRDAASLDTDGDGDFDQDDKATASIGGPSVAGDYEVRYVLDKPRLILARKPLKVTESAFKIEVPAESPVSSTIEIKWEGPRNERDFLTLIEAGSDDVFRNGWTAKLKDGEPSTITAPSEPGDYEIRYILANGYTLYPGMQMAVQATAPIKITEIAASVSGPVTAVGGSTIDVTWSGPNDQKKDDLVSITTPGAIKHDRKISAKLFGRDMAPQNPVPIRTPAIEGEYEIVYVLNPGNRIVARTHINITRAHASVSAPATVKAGQDFEVTYTGDAFKGDRVMIMPADTPDDRMWQWGGNYGFFAKQDESAGTIAARLTAEPGEYEVRYVTGQQNQVLARAAVVITN